MFESLGINSGTTIIAQVVDGSLFVASDSLQHSLADKSETGRPCKLTVVGDRLAAIAGMASANNQYAKWDAVLLLRKAISTTSDLPAQVNAYIESVRRVVVPHLDGSFRRAPSWFDSKMRDRERFQALFASQQEEHFYIVILVPQVVRGRVSLDPRISRLSRTDPVAGAVLGHGNEINSFLRMNPNYFGSRKTIVEQMAFLISLQAAAAPCEVGGAVSVIEVNSAGIHWLERGACAATETGESEAPSEV